MTLTTRQLAELIGCGTNNLKRVLSDPVTQALSADGIQIDRPGHGKFSIRLGHPVNR
jgi:hypothetical protein